TNPFKSTQDQIASITKELEELEKRGPVNINGRTNEKVQKRYDEQKKSLEQQLAYYRAIDAIENRRASRAMLDAAGGGAGAPSGTRTPTKPALPTIAATGPRKLTEEEKADLAFIKEAWSYVEKTQDAANTATQELILSNHEAAEAYRDLLDPTREITREMERIDALVSAGALTPDEAEAIKIERLKDSYKG